MPWKDISYFLIILAGSVVGICRHKKLSSSSKILLYLLLYTLCSELISEILKRVISNNLMVFHIYNPAQYFILAIAFNNEIRQTKVIVSSIIGYLFFAVLNAIIWQPFFDEYCSYSFNINVVLVSSLCLYYLYRLLQDETDDHFSDYPLFWISIGYLIYNCINLLGLGAFNHLSKDSSVAYVLEVVRTMSNYLLYAMFIIAFLTKQKSLNR